MKIGAAHQNFQSASFSNFFLFWPPIGDVKLSLLFLYVYFVLRTIFKPFLGRDTIGAGGICAPIVMARGASVRQDIGAPMSLSANRQC